MRKGWGKKTNIFKTDHYILDHILTKCFTLCHQFLTITSQEIHCHFCFQMKKVDLHKGRYLIQINLTLKYMFFLHTRE